MARRSARIIPLPIRQRLVCSKCGADGEGTCRCGVAYVPAGERAAEAVKANPGKSNRTIAKAIGTDEQTVRAARQTGTAGCPAVVEAQGLRGPDGVIRRQGLDGKWRKLPVRSKAPKVVLIGGDEPVSPRRAKQIARDNERLAGLPMARQVNSFIDELTKFEEDFGERLLAWHAANPGLIDDDAQHVLVLFLSKFSMRIQLLAQRIDGR